MQNSHHDLIGMSEIVNFGGKPCKLGNLISLRMEMKLSFTVYTNFSRQDTLKKIDKFIKSELDERDHTRYDFGIALIENEKNYLREP